MHAYDPTLSVTGIPIDRVSLQCKRILDERARNIPLSAKESKEWKSG